MSRLAAALLIAACLIAPAIGADRTVIVGTRMIVQLPEGFVPLGRASSLINADRTAQISYMDMLGGDARLAGARSDPEILKDMVREFDGMSVRRADLVTLGVTDFLIQEEVLHDMGEVHAWAVSVGPDGRASLVFFQVPDVAAPTFDRERVLQILTSLKLLESKVTDAGVYSRGLFVARSPYFTQATVDDAGFIRFATRPKGGPFVSTLIYPSIVQPKSLSDIADLSEDLRSTWVLEQAADVTFAGAPALRRVGTFRYAGQTKRTVVYAAFVGGQAIRFYGQGSAEEMTPEVVAAVDALAATVRIQNEADWASAYGELK